MRPSVRPIPLNASRRVQSITPMPQVRRMSQFRPMASSPPPFEGTGQTRLSQFEDIFGSVSVTGSQPSNIALLARGVSLLSIAQLRDLLRDFSLPTGGNKHLLVNRLIIYLETFGQNQQNLLTQFSAKLKRLLSVEPDDTSRIQVPDDPLPQPTSVDPPHLLSVPSPSCLYEPVDAPAPFPPVVLQPPMAMTQAFTIPEAPSGSVPILQFFPAYPDAQIQRLAVQIGGVMTYLRGGALWYELRDFVNRQGTVQVLQIEPLVPIMMVIRWMRVVPVIQLVQKIVTANDPMPVAAGSAVDPVCPLTRKLIARPARSVRCAHAQCFDLTGFLCSAIKNNVWTCPVCHAQVQPEELRVDPNFFARVKCE